MPVPPDTADITRCRRCEDYVRIITLVNGAKLAVDAFKPGDDPTWPLELRPGAGGRVVAYYDDDQGKYVHGWFVAKGSRVLDFTPGSRGFRPHADHCRA